MGFLEDLVEYSSNRVEEESSLEFFRGRSISLQACFLSRVGFVDGETPFFEDPFRNHEDCDINRCDYCRFTSWFYKGKECRFNGHVLFPLTDFKNRVIGFSLRGIKKKSFESFLTRRDTSAVLFKSTRAISEIYEQNAVYITEGPVDLLSLLEAEIPNSVAIMTNNMSKNQVRWLNRISDHFYLAMDQDEAGNLGSQNAKYRLGDSNCTRIKWNEYSKCKDLNDLLSTVGKGRFRKIVLGAES